MTNHSPVLFGFVVTFCLLLIGCHSERPAVIQSIASPASSFSGQPSLTAANDGIYLSWLGKKDNGQALYFAKWDGLKWTQPSVISSNLPYFVNWADFPSLMVSDSGLMAAHWLQKSGEGTYAYDVQVAVSEDHGGSWGPALKPHSDSKPNEHGFVSLAPSNEYSFSTLWLDSRNFVDDAESNPANTMSLMHALYRDGQFESDRTIDSRVCDCCQTGLSALSGDRLIAVYRDRTDPEIRDISYSIYENAKWSAPKTLHNDGWTISGCPVNGPSVDARDDDIVIAWFTGAKNQPKVHVIFSTDGGKTFGPPHRIDNGNPLGRVDVVWLENGSALVAWMENTNKDGAEIRIREVKSNGVMTGELTVGETAGTRSSGFPRISANNDEALIAWTDPTAEQVKLARYVAAER